MAFSGSPVKDPALGNGDKDLPLYLQLFYKMVQMEEMKNDVLRSMMKMNDTEFRQLKKYLFDKLSDFLIQYDKQSPRIRINKSISLAEVFYLRGFADDALVQLSRAEVEAQEFEFIEERQTILEWKHKILLHKGAWEELSQVIESINESSKVQNELSLWKRTYMQVLKLEQNGVHPSEETSIHLAKLLQNPFWAQEPEVNLVRIKVLYNLSKSLLLRLTGEYEASSHALSRVVNLFNENKSLRLSQPNLVIKAYSNLLLNLASLNANEEFDRRLKESESFEFLSASQNQKKALALGQCKLKRAIINREDVDEIFEFAETLLHELEKYPHDELFRTEVFYTVTEGFIFAKAYRKALTTLNKIITSGWVFRRFKSFEPFVRLMELVIHFESKDSEFLQNRIRNLSYLLKQNNNSFETEIRLLNFFKAINKKPNPKSVEWRKLANELEAIKQSQPLERNFYFYFNIHLWAQQKAEEFE